MRKGMRVIGVYEDTYKRLIRIKALMELERGERVSMDRLISELIETYSKVRNIEV